MPSQRHHEPGNLYIKINIKFPESIPEASIPLLESALPPRQPLDKFDKNVILEEVVLEEPDSSHRAHRGMHDEDMDEDGDGDGEPRVQCANQ